MSALAAPTIPYSCYTNPSRPILAPEDYFSKLHPTPHISPPPTPHYEPHANPWIFTNTPPPPPLPRARPPITILHIHDDGTYERRPQTPEPRYDSDDEDEILLLDDDIMERDLDTGFVGECGERGCMKAIGCVSCKGGDRAPRPVNPTPRSTFRTLAAWPAPHTVPIPGAHSRQPLPTPPRSPLAKEAGYPQHLQRLENPTTIVVVVPPAPVAVVVPVKTTGPKIKYVKKRASDAAPVKRVVPQWYKRKKAGAGTSAMVGGAGSVGN